MHCACEVRRRPQAWVVTGTGISIQCIIRVKRRAFPVALRDSRGSIPLSSVDDKRLVLMRDETEDIRWCAGGTARNEEYLGVTNAPQCLDGLLREIEGRYLVARIVRGAEALGCERHGRDHCDGKQHDRHERLDEGEAASRGGSCRVPG